MRATGIDRARDRRGLILLGLGVVCGLAAALVALTGDIDTRIVGVPGRSRSWQRPATIAAVLLLTAAIPLRHHLAAAARLAVLLPLIAALWAGAVG